MTAKHRIIAFWVSTALLAAAFVFGGVSDLAQSPMVLQSLERLGYPLYFATLLGVWKLLGAVAIVVPGFPRVKEWAYAGMFFDLSGAAISHAAVGDPIVSVVPPLVLLVLLLVSWTSRPVSRTLDPHSRVALASTLLVVGGVSIGCARAVSAPEPAGDAASVVRYWREGGEKLWFGKDPELDRRLRERFLSLHEAAARGELAAWQATPEGALALVILLDQFPRNAFRDTPRMYSTDAAGRAVAEAAIRAGHDHATERELRVFFYLPFAHSENLADQDRCVELTRALDAYSHSRAKHHRDIIRRFGRFPHRNRILGRTTTPHEQHYLDNGGFKG